MYCPGADPGFPVGGCGPPTQAFSVKMDVKRKELGPAGGGRAPENFVCRSANVVNSSFSVNLVNPDIIT